MDHMTALVSTFARAYHYRNNRVHVFADSFAEKMLTEEEYASISMHMAQGISFFAPSFSGTAEEALRFIVDKQLSPSVLARSAFCEQAIERAVRKDCGQIVIYACGFDTFSLRTDHPALTVFELDLPEMIEERQKRMKQRNLKSTCQEKTIGCDLSLPAWKDILVGEGFDRAKPAFASLLGISYYLSKEDFGKLVGDISSISPEGSFLCFDYPLLYGKEESERTRELAAAAGEPMKAKYSPEEMEGLLCKAGFQMYEHLNAEQATKAYFQEYNQRNEKHPMTAPEGVGYCLAVK